MRCTRIAVAAVTIALAAPAVAIGAADLDQAGQPALAAAAEGKPRRAKGKPRRTAKPEPRRVVIERIRVLEGFFSPDELTVRPGTRIVWKWSAANIEGHDVQLASGPRGVERFTSPSATTDFSFTRTLEAKGTYRLLCTYHPNMTQTIVVR
jgi:plastocyanin